MMKEFPYLYRGVVLENKDPKNLGRCKVRVPSIHGGEVPPEYLPWARGISNITIGPKKGSASVPDIGDIVWILFESGDKDSPVYIGGTHSLKDIPIDLNKVVLYQEEEDSIYYLREERLFDIKIGDVHILVSPNLVNIKGETLIEGDVTIRGKLHVTGTITSDIDVYGGGVSLKRHVHSGVESGPSRTGPPV